MIKLIAHIVGEDGPEIVIEVLEMKSRTMVLDAITMLVQMAAPAQSYDFFTRRMAADKEAMDADSRES